VLKIASHGPASVEGRSTISRDGPAQVNDRGRRRDGGVSFTVTFTQRDGEDRKRETESLPWRKPTDLPFNHLADALGMSAISFRNFLAALWSSSAAPFFVAVL
jgi:hypothetical protein